MQLQQILLLVQLVHQVEQQSRLERPIRHFFQHLLALLVQAQIEHAHGHVETNVVAGVTAAAAAPTFRPYAFVVFERLPVLAQMKVTERYPLLLLIVRLVSTELKWNRGEI